MKMMEFSNGIGIQAWNFQFGQDLGWKFGPITNSDVNSTHEHTTDGS